MKYTSEGDVIYDSDGRPSVSPSKLLTLILGQTRIYLLQFEGTKRIRSQIRTSTGQVRTDIVVRKLTGRVCHVFGYEPHDALDRLTEKDVKRGPYPCKSVELTC